MLVNRDSQNLTDFVLQNITNYQGIPYCTSKQQQNYGRQQ